MKTLITGISGTLGTALGKACLARGEDVVGVGRKEIDVQGRCTTFVANAQRTAEDARVLLDLDVDRIFLCAGQIEEEVGRMGLPLIESTQSLHVVNSLFPSLLVLEAADRVRGRPLDVIAIGSIADGSPSAFGPVYHASKSALHHFVTGAGPIVHAANPHVRIRLYRPGVIKGPLSWAPTVRLNESGRKVRARRCRKAPEAFVVAERLLKWADTDKWVGSDPEPISFRLLKLFWGLAPNAYYRLQVASWRRVSRYGDAETARTG